MIFEFEEEANGTNIPMGRSWSKSFYPIKIELKEDEKESEKILDLNSIVNSMNSFSDKYTNTENIKLIEDFNGLKIKMNDIKNSFANLEKKNNNNEKKDENDEKNDEDNEYKEQYLCEIGNVYKKGKFQPKQTTSSAKINAPGTVLSIKEHYSNLIIRVGWGQENDRALFQVNYHNLNFKEDSNFELINLKNLKYEKENQKKGLVAKNQKNNKIENSLKISKGKLLQEEIEKIKNDIESIDKFISEIESKIENQDQYTTEEKMEKNFEKKWKEYNSTFIKIKSEISKLKILSYVDFQKSFKDILKNNFPENFINTRFDAYCY